jgi:carboxylesterase type B
MIAVSINYRLSAWGFLKSDEVTEAGVTNLGIRDQRLALHWVQENIAEFGGDPSRVTIWGESAGAGSIGIHVTAYGGRDDKLFSGAIGESGSPILLGSETFNQGQAIYSNITRDAGCSNATDTLACLRAAPFDTLNKAINVTTAYDFEPYPDGDIIHNSTSQQLLDGDFVKVPYLIGTNSDEGSQFGTVVNTDEEFAAFVATTGADNATNAIIQILYPDIPALNVLDTIYDRPNSTIGSQLKRVASYIGDYKFIAGRRLTTTQWAAYNTSAYAYRFNNLVNGHITDFYGSGHFIEVAFVFNNVLGTGYATNEFENMPPAYYRLSKLMSNMWISFINDGNPNGHGFVGVPEWPVYDNGYPGGGYGKDFVFDANTTTLGYAEPDTFRGEAIAYLNTLWKSQFST